MMWLRGFGDLMLWVGAFALMGGAILVVTWLIGWVARGFQKGDDDDDWVV